MSEKTWKSSALQELEWRGLIHQVTHPQELDTALAQDTVTFYTGFDPTAFSLHVGNLLPLMVMLCLQRHGHRPLPLIGTATGLIGDPSGKDRERELKDEAIVQEYAQKITAQISTFFRRNALEEVTTVSNLDWFAGYSFIDFLRGWGKHFKVNQMLSKESVRSRLESREQGISFTEFSYMILQACDFLHLYKHHACTLQIGGSDQWGNITEGIDLIRRLEGATTSATAYGLTIPLLTTSEGRKMGKSEKGAVFLDPSLTSPYDFYQYWRQQSDADLPKLLKAFTTLSKEAIESILEGEPGEGQEVLAYEVTSLIHGEAAARRAKHSAAILFGGSLSTDLRDEDIQEIFKTAPSTTVDLEHMTLVDLLVVTALCKSKGQARKLIAQGGAYLNNVRQENDRQITRKDLATESMLVLRFGKKTYHIVKAASA